MEPEHDNLENTNLNVNDETLAQADDNEIPRIPQGRQVGKSHKRLGKSQNNADRTRRSARLFMKS